MPAASGIRGAFRSWTGPFIIAAGCWCAAGQLTVVTPDDASARFAIPAAGWWFVAGLLIGCALPRWRTDTRTALPALLTILPWLPVPLPAIALVWTGPLAWVPLAFALFAAIGATTDARAPRAPNERSPRLAAWVAGALTFSASLATAVSTDPRLPGGDEPHYLIIAQSLLKDGDLRIQNNHDRRDYESYYAGNLNPDFLVLGRNRQVYSIHAPGTSVLVLPAFALFGYNGARATIMLASAIAGGLIWWIGWLVTRSRKAAWFAWAAIVTSTTFLLQSTMVFPDGAALLATAAGLWLVVRLMGFGEGLPRARSMVLGSAGIAALPWLHTRLAILAGGFGALIVWRLVIESGCPIRERLRRAAVCFALPVVSAIGWFTYFWVIYGTLNPTAPYGRQGADGTHLVYAPGGVIGLLFDQEFGLIAYAPVLLVAILGLAARVDAKIRRLASPIVALAAVQLAASSAYWMWWGGKPATPARFATAVLPLATMPLAVAWASLSKTSRAMLTLLLLISASTALLVIGYSRAALAWNVYDARAQWLVWLNPIVNLPRAWPSFFSSLVAGPNIMANARSELTFVVHVTMAIAIFACGWIVTTLLIRDREPSSGGRRLVAVWWFVGCLMVAVQIGWWATRAQPLEPMSSQLAVLDRVAQGARAFNVGPLRVAPARSPLSRMVMRVGDPGRFGDPPWLVTSSVPPGVYQVRLRLPSPRDGTVTIRVGDWPGAWRTLPVLALSEQSFTLALPAGAMSVTVDPDSTLRDFAGVADLSPVHLMGDATSRAWLARRYGTTDVFFLDGDIVEGDGGFWVRSGGAGTISVSSSTQPAGTLHLQSGDAATAVAITLGSSRVMMSLAPSESRDVPLPEGSDPVLVRIALQTAPSPRDGTGDPSRGLRVEIR